VNLIHGVDSLKLLQKSINRHKTIRLMDYLLQMHITEETKFGLDERKNSLHPSWKCVSRMKKTYE
jgi:hypothetical protein